MPTVEAPSDDQTADADIRSNVQSRALLKPATILGVLRATRWGWVELGWVGFGLGWVGLAWLGLGLVGLCSSRIDSKARLEIKEVFLATADEA
jgi:hypothetical protein